MEPINRIRMKLDTPRIFVAAIIVLCAVLSPAFTTTLQAQRLSSVSPALTGRALSERSLDAILRAHTFRFTLGEKVVFVPDPNRRRKFFVARPRAHGQFSRAWPGRMWETGRDLRVPHGAALGGLDRRDHFINVTWGDGIDTKLNSGRWDCTNDPVPGATGTLGAWKPTANLEGRQVVVPSWVRGRRTWRLRVRRLLTGQEFRIRDSHRECGRPPTGLIPTTTGFSKHRHRW